MTKKSEKPETTQQDKSLAPAVVRRYQFVNYYPKWQGFGFRKTKPKEAIYLIYEWFLFWGYWNVRYWRRNSEKALKKYKEANA